MCGPQDKQNVKAFEALKVDLQGLVRTLRHNTLRQASTKDLLQVRQVMEKEAIGKADRRKRGDTPHRAIG